MNLLPWMTRRLLVALVAMAILFGLLVAATVRLLSSENTQTDYISEDMVWLSSQTQYEAMRYADALNAFALGKIELEDAQLPLDLLSSRISFLEEGETYRQMTLLGFAEAPAGFRKVVDDATERMVGLKPSDSVEIASLHEDALTLAGDMRDVANAAMFGKRDTETDTRIRRRNILFEVLGTLAATMIAGLLLGAILVRDHRNMVSAESALERERQVSRLHRAFISVVSHQFRTPLAIIDASAQRMIRRGPQMNADEIGQRAGKIRAACLRLTRLMESTLNAARLEDGEIALNIRACDPVRLLRDVVDGQPDQDQKRIALELDVLPSWIEADATLLEQAVQNLVSNALKYSPDGQSVTVKAVRAGPEILVSVVDKGVGIPADEMSQLFRRFFRARTAEGIPGTGIGLSFVGQIMDLHHGKVDVTSVEGSGSTFTLHIPIDHPAASKTSTAGSLTEATASS